MDSILITGSSGFLGHHLATKLVEKKKIIGLSSNINKEYMFPQISCDVRNIINIPEEITCIVHFAALTDVNRCESNPNDCFDINVMGTKNMLNLARKLDSKFIFASTSHVYGSPQKLPVTESMQLNPMSVYAKSKVAGELLCETYSKSYGLDIIIARSFSIYGPQSPLHLVTTKIIKQILNSTKIKIGDLSPKRDFLYVEDVVSAFEILIERNLKGFSKFNIGSSKSISIQELCDMLIKISNKKIKIESDKTLFRKSDVPDLFCDTSLMKCLGWKPKFSLEEGLRRTFEWFKNEPNK